MKKYLTLLVCLALPLQADPFNKLNRRIPIIEDVVEQTEKSGETFKDAKGVSICEDEHSPVLWADNSFSTLQLVGILQQQEHWQGLFSNGKQVLLVKVGDVLAREFAKIESIDKYQLSFSIRQQGSCHLREVVNIQF